MGSMKRTNTKVSELAVNSIKFYFIFHLQNLVRMAYLFLVHDPVVIPQSKSRLSDCRRLLPWSQTLFPANRKHVTRYLDNLNYVII